MEIAGSLLAGGAIGAVLGFVGAGGAMLSVPILVYIFKFPAHQASVAALAIVVIAAISGLYPRIKSSKNGEVLYKEALVISGIGAIANIFAAQVAKHLSDAYLLTGFSAVIIFAALTMLQKPVTAPEKPIPWPILILLSLIIGSMTGLFGIGGGFLAIPVLVLAFNNSHNKAAGTSLLIITLNCLIALIAHRSIWPEINWSTPIYMALGALVVGQWAGKKSLRTNPVILRRSFAALLFAIAAFTLIETWFI